MPICREIVGWGPGGRRLESICLTESQDGLTARLLMTDVHVELLRPADVARRLGVSRSWLYEAARQGRVPCVRLGGTDGPLRFMEHDLAEWLERGRSRDVPPHH